jgi:hypothetical protein
MLFWPAAKKAWNGKKFINMKRAKKQYPQQLVESDIFFGKF